MLSCVIIIEWGEALKYLKEEEINSPLLMYDQNPSTSRRLQEVVDDNYDEAMLAFDDRKEELGSAIANRAISKGVGNSYEQCMIAGRFLREKGYHGELVVRGSRTTVSGRTRIYGASLRIGGEKDGVVLDPFASEVTPYSEWTLEGLHYQSKRNFWLNN